MEKGANLSASDDDLAISRVASPGIRYAPDVESGPRRGRLERRHSQESTMSTRRSMSKRRSVDPGVVLPIQYRTVSYKPLLLGRVTVRRGSVTAGLVAGFTALSIALLLNPRAESSIVCHLRVAEDVSSFNIAESQARSLDKDHEPDKHTQEFSAIEWHTITVDEVYRRLSTGTAQGLSQEQANRRLKEYGKNMLSPPPSQWLMKTIRYLFGGFGTVLLAASILVFVAWKPLGDPPAVANLALAIVLALVWVAQAAFSFYQDFSSSRVMDSITNMLPDECTVLRDGQQVNISGVDIVPGDILLLKMGDKLSADVRFIEATPDTKLDRSILTGETDPLRATIDSTDDNYLETANIGMAGSHCTSGTARAVVVATGDHTVFGQLAKLTTVPKAGLTTMEKEIYYFVAFIVALMITMVLVVIIVWAAWLRKKHPDWINVSLLIVDCVSIAVAFIPEGLPIAVTSSLTITASIMKRNKILCKSLKTVETLGSVNVICSDKTGTLTKNKMAVTDCLIGTDSIPAGIAAELTKDHASVSSKSINSKSLSQLQVIGAVCNGGEFDVTTLNQPLAERHINGDATDQAVLRFSESLGSVVESRSSWTKLFRLPFNSKNKYMVHVAQNTSNEKTGEILLMIKGAPDILIPRCTHYMASDGSSQPFTDVNRKTVEDQKDTWSADAKRVILLARKTLPSTYATMAAETQEFEDAMAKEAASGLELVGLVGIVDPPRDEIPDVVRTLRGAGVKVFMVTGDFKLTAHAIARACGIVTQHSDDVDDVSALGKPQSRPLSPGLENVVFDNVMTNSINARTIVLSGGELNNLDEDQWDDLCEYDEVVFARTTPEQKLRIVKELQKRGQTVGMTGDGVNDAPSLKEADIGIAMGSGSDIAIEAADMVLLDSFSAIVEALKYGRVVFENLKKTICYLLPAGSFSEFWPVMTNVVFGLPQILSSFLMIVICCFTDCAAAIAIAYEKPEADVLLRPPRDPRKDRLVNWKLLLHAYGFLGVLMTLTSFSMGYWYAERQGVPFDILWFGFGDMPEGMKGGVYNDILFHASSIYFVNLVVMQWFNLLAVRTRRLSLLQHPPLFRRETSNWYLFPAAVFALLIAIFFLYVPKFQEVLDTTGVPVEHWFLPMGFGMGILLLDEARKWAVRRNPQSLLGKMAW